MKGIGWSRLMSSRLLLFLLFSCVHAQNENTYDDAYAKKIFDLGFYQFSTNPQVCVPKYYPAYAHYALIRAPAVGMFTTAQVSIAVSVSEKTVNVFFRGAQDIGSFISGGLTAVLGNFPLVEWQFGTKVGTDYITTYQALIQAGLRTAINNCWTEYCDFKLVIGGHSVGSCLGQMLALYAVKTDMWPADKIELWNFGAPRCGNQFFALSVDAAIPYRYRIQNNADIIPSMPYTTCSRSSTPTLATAQECYWHCCYAIKYSKSLFGGVSIKRCAQPESTTCTAALLDLNPFDHVAYFTHTNLAEYNSYTC